MVLSKYDDLSSYQRPRTLLALLRTNDVPNPMEVGILKGSLFHVQNDIRRIVADLDRLSYGDADVLSRDTCRQLHNRLALLEEIEYDHRVPLLLIRRIPPEILREIFLYTAGFFSDIFNAGSEPWVIGQVSRSWRSVCIFMCPGLWSRIEIRSSDDQCVRKKDPMALLRMVLSRSRQHRLDIRVTSSIGSTMWEELIATAERWTNIYLTSIGLQEVGYLSHVRGRLGRLEECHLEYSCEGLDFIDAFDYTPALKKIKVFGLDLNTLFHITSANLELFVDDRDVWSASASIHDHHLKLLQDSPNLKVFYAPYRCPAGRTVFPRITKPSLSELTVCDNSLIRSLSLPQLTDVALFNDCWVNPIDCLASFQDLLIQSHCNTLTTLQISDIILHPENLLRIFELSPALVSFYYQTHEWSAQNDDILKILFRRLSDSQALVPHLKDVVLELTLFSETDVHCASRKMVDMMVARLGLSLQKFHLTATVPDEGFCNLGEDDFERLRTMKMEGFDVVISSCGSDIDEERHVYV